MEFDAVVAGGTVLDGTGASRFRADVGIIGDRIAAVGDLSGARAQSRVDASGRMVAPGFIDVHAHSERALRRAHRDGVAPLQMGVTTQFSAPDGFSWAPLASDRAEEMRAYLAVFYGDEDSKDAGAADIDAFLSAFSNGLPGNLVLQVPHAAVRVSVMGWATRPAGPDELVRMANIVRAWTERGAVSFSTGLEYEPARHADLAELVALSRAAYESGAIYVAHQRGYGEKVVEGLEETLAVSKLAGVPVHVSHLTVDARASDVLAQAIDRGVRITFDKYPYQAGCTHLLMGLPAAAQAGPPQAVLARLADPAFCAAIRPALEQAFEPDQVRFAAVDTAQPTDWEGKTLREVCQELDKSVADGIVEVLRRTELRALMIYHSDEERPDLMRATFRHPLHMVSSDGLYYGLRPHPRGYGTYPRVLGRFVREQQWLSLESAVHKMGGFPAEVFHLVDRGTIRRGAFADLVVFDPDAISDRATFEEPRQPPVGIDYVFVNGRIAVDHGAVRDRRSGRLLGP